jgi:hypothetical protein
VTAIDLLAWTQTMLLDGDLALAEPKALRYRLLHVAARITHGTRRNWQALSRSTHAGPMTTSTGTSGLPTPIAGPVLWSKQVADSRSSRIGPASRVTSC